MSTPIYGNRYQNPANSNWPQYPNPTSQQSTSENSGLNTAEEQKAEGFSVAEQALIDQLHTTEERMAEKLTELENKYKAALGAGNDKSVLRELEKLDSIIDSLESDDMVLDQLCESLNRQGIETVNFNIDEKVAVLESEIQSDKTDLKKAINEEKAKEKADAEEEKKEVEEQEKKEEAKVEQEKKDTAIEMDSKLNELSGYLDGRKGWIFAARINKDTETFIYDYRADIKDNVTNIINSMHAGFRTGDWNGLKNIVNKIESEGEYDKADLTICTLFAILEKDPDVLNELPIDVLQTLKNKLGDKFTNPKKLGGLRICYLPPDGYAPKDKKARLEMMVMKTNPQNVAQALDSLIYKKQNQSGK